MKSNFIVGYHFTVTGSPRSSNGFANIVISCKLNFPKYGDKRCPAVIRAVPVDRNDLEGPWKVVEFLDAHNHLSNSNTYRAWKPPKLAPKHRPNSNNIGRKGNNHLSDRGEGISDGDEESYGDSSSSEEEESEEDELESECASGDEEEGESDEAETLDRKSHIPSKRLRTSDTNQSNKVSRQSTNDPRSFEGLDIHRSTRYLPSPAVDSPSRVTPIHSTSTTTTFASLPTHNHLTIACLSSFLYQLSPTLLPYANSLFSEGLDSTTSVTNFIALPRRSKRKLIDRWVEKGIILAFPGAQLAKKLHEI